MGLRSTKGNPIKKPWRIVTTSSSLVAKLSPCICNKKHTHDICQGAETFKTGFYTDALSTKIITGLLPMNIVNPSGPIAVSPSFQLKPVVKSKQQTMHSHPLRCGTEPVNGITSSGGTVGKIVQHATQQMEKAVVRASAKLETLVETLLKNTESLKSYNIETQNSFLVDDKNVEKQLLFHQIDAIQKEMKHREKVDL